MAWFVWWFLCRKIFTNFHMKKCLDRFQAIISFHSVLYTSQTTKLSSPSLLHSHFNKPSKNTKWKWKECGKLNTELKQFSTQNERKTFPIFSSFLFQTRKKSFSWHFCAVFCDVTSFFHSCFHSKFIYTIFVCIHSRENSKQQQRQRGEFKRKFSIFSATTRGGRESGKLFLLPSPKTI